MKKLRFSWKSITGAVLLVGAIVIGGPLVAGNTEEAGCGGAGDEADLAEGEVAERPADVEGEIVDNLLAAGFPHEEIGVLDDGTVYVGGDAVVTLEASREMAAAQGAKTKPGSEADRSKQYSTNNLIASSVEKICVNGAAFTGTISTALDAAIARYNALPLHFQLERISSGSGPGCDAVITGNVVSGTGGLAGFPSGGMPYNTFDIGSGIPTTYGLAPTTHVVMHELGHCIGFRHSDYYDRSISCNRNEYELPGTEGANLIPGTPAAATWNGSVMNACYNAGSTGLWTDSDVVALKTLYATQSIDGTWSASGGRDMNHPGNPRYVLEVLQQSTLELNLTSAIDTYLYLLDPAGNLLHQNDDGGAGYNSRLNLTLTPGRYIMVAATYSNGQNGPFTISSSHGVVSPAPTSVVNVSGDGAQFCPDGSTLATRADVTSNRSAAEATMGTWDIVRLADGWAFRGSGYGYDFKIESGTGATMCAIREVASASACAPAERFEPFDYALGILHGQSGTSERGLSSTWNNVGFRQASVTSGTLSYPAGTFALTPQGGQFDAYGNGGAQGAFVRSFAANIGDSEGAVTRWFSMLVQPKDGGSNGGFNGLRIYGDAGSDILLGWGNTGSDRVWTFDRFGGGSAGGGISNVSITQSLGQTVLLVGKIEFSGDGAPERLRLFINPGSTEPADSAAVAVADDIDFGNLTKLGLQWNHSAFLDEIRIAECYTGLASE